MTTATLYVVRTKKCFRINGDFNQYYDHDVGWYLKKKDGFSPALLDAELYGTEAKAGKAIKARSDVANHAVLSDYLEIVPVEVRELA